MKKLRSSAARVSALTKTDKQRLDQAYQALHRAGAFRELAEHAIPYVYLRGKKKRYEFGISEVNAAIAYILETKKYDKDGSPAGSITPVIQAWDSRKSRFGTWISNNTFYSFSSTSYYSQKQDKRQTRDQSKLVAQINASANTITVGESKKIIIDPQAESAADVFAWAEEFIPNDAPAATEHDLHLYNCLLNDRDLKRGRRRQRIIDLIGDEMDQPAIALLLGVSLRTIQGDYNYIRTYIGRERGSVTDIKEFARRNRNKRDPAKAAEIFQQQETARIERQKRAADAQLFDNKPVLSPGSGRPVLQPRIIYRKRRSKSAPAWLAVYHELRRSHPHLRLDQKNIEQKFGELPISYKEATDFIEHCARPTIAAPLPIRYSADDRLDAPIRGWWNALLMLQSSKLSEPVIASQAPEDVHPPEAARRLSATLKGWQKPERSHRAGL